MASPINSRTNAPPLTLELLKEHVPYVKAGQTARQELSDAKNTLTLETKQGLLAQQMKGSKSQEVLIISGLPLIKNIASKEFQRRKAWSSRITYDDVLQEAIAGFIRGLLSYDETTEHNSPINYLSMWVTTTIRRRVEALEHDFAIPYEVVERARRIRAVSSRLNNELSRAPNDEELLDALNTPAGYPRNKWGTNETPKPRSGAKKFTQAHLEEARQLNSISYGLQSYESHSDENDETYEKSSTPLTSETGDTTETFESSDLSRSRLDFFNQAFMQMKMGSKQQDIILRFFGLSKYTEPQNQKDIIANTGHPARFVKAVITAFSTYMPQPGGVFHYLLINADPDTIEGLELSWLLPILGEWPNTNQPEPAPQILTQQNTRTKTVQ